MDDMLRKPNTRSMDVTPSAPPLPGNIPAAKLSSMARTTIQVRSDEAATPVALTPPAPRPKPAAAAEPQDLQAPEATDDSGIMAESDEPERDVLEPETADEAPAQPKTPSTNPLKRFFGGYWHKKWLTIPLTILVIVGIIAAVPQSRYPLLALMMKRAYDVSVLDSTTHAPVSGVRVTLDGIHLTTDSTGKAAFTVPVGKGTVTVSKKYYQTAHKDIFVGISTSHNAISITLIATGRQVPIKVIDKISGKPVPNASVKAAGTEAITDASGGVSMVLPTTDPTEPVTVSADSYTTLAGMVQITSDAVPANTFAIVPAGRVYFLSNLSGKIDVVSTNLDGSDRKTVLAGTGSEDNANTVLLASRDWQYLALLSKRDGGNHAKLFLINTNNNQVTTIDSTGAELTPIGWGDHNFVYQAQVDGVQPWQPGLTLLKTYSADASKGATIDQTSAQGAAGNYIYQTIGFVNLVDDRVVYGLAWSAYYANTSLTISGQSNAILSVKADGTGKKDLRDITLPTGTTYTGLTAVVPKPETLYVQSSVQSQPSVYYSYQYANNSVTQSSTITDATYGQAQQSTATYLLSPTGKSTFWSQLRDGKNTLFTGDDAGNNGTQIASLSPYAPYGWYTDNYLLVQKGGSELYVMPAAGGTPLKISDYYKPQNSFYGYGGGYGGL